MPMNVSFGLRWLQLIEWNMPCLLMAGILGLVHRYPLLGHSLKIMALSHS